MKAIDRLIEDENHFVLHTPRQVGKTTAMLALAKTLTASGRYAALMFSDSGLMGLLGKTMNCRLSEIRAQSS